MLALFGLYWTAPGFASGRRVDGNGYRLLAGQALNLKRAARRLPFGIEVHMKFRLPFAHLSRPEHANFCFQVLALGWLYAATLNAIAHEQALNIGRTATGQLKVANVFNPPVALPRSVFPGVVGQATGAVGIHSVFLDDPSHDIFQISPEADCRFILLAKQPGMEVWDDHGVAYMNVGQSFYIGPAPFDTHPIWNITVPTNGVVYTLTLQIHDVNGVYEDSEPFDVQFTPIAPAQLSIEDNQDSVVIYIQGTADADYVLQGATTLGIGADWTNIVTNHSDFYGFSFSVPSKDGYPSRYFRCLNH